MFSKALASFRLSLDVYGVGTNGCRYLVNLSYADTRTSVWKRKIRGMRQNHSLPKRDSCNQAGVCFCHCSDDFNTSTKFNVLGIPGHAAHVEWTVSSSTTKRGGLGDMYQTDYTLLAML